MGETLWRDLPRPVQTAIERECGHVAEVEYPSAGRCSEFSATLHTDAGRVFAKGSSTESRNAWMHRNEARVNGYLPSLAPRLLWQVEQDGWIMHGYQHVAGRHANLAPGSPDLVAIADAVAALHMKLAPCPPADVGDVTEQWIRLSAWQRLRDAVPGDLDPWTRERLDQFASDEPRALEQLRGDTLLHTDLHSLNILVGDGIHVIDWAWSRRGAAWVDTAFLVLRLIAAGHTPADAERWATAVPAWRDAPDVTLTAFAQEVLGVWEHLQRAHPLPHRAELTDIARAWARYRTESEGV